MALAQDNTASACSMNISGMQMILPKGMAAGPGPGSSSRSGAELEPKSHFSSPEDFPEP